MGHTKTITIGRDPSNNIVIKDPSEVVSRNHGTIKLFENGSIIYCDHSTNGTFVNDGIIHNREVSVKRGDKIVFPNNYKLNWDQVPGSGNVRVQGTVIRETFSSSSQVQAVPILVEIQENIIRSKAALDFFERDFMYKFSKTFGGKTEFETTIRGLYNSSIDLRNTIILKVEAIIRKSENKALIDLIDSGYFRSISEAMSKESLIRVVNAGSISIPETSMRVVLENKEIDGVMSEIAQEIKGYNRSVSKLKQDRNRFFIRIYSIPGASDLPKEIEGTVSLFTLLNGSGHNNLISQHNVRGLL